MERLTPSALTEKICSLLNATDFCATAETIKKFAEEEFILEKELDSKNNQFYGKIQLPTKVSVISYFYEPYLFMLSEFEKSQEHNEDYFLEAKINNMADFPVGDSTALPIKQICEPERIFSRFPLYGRIPEQYEQMIDSHLGAFLNLHSEIKNKSIPKKALQNIKNSFLKY